MRRRPEPKRTPSLYWTSFIHCLKAANAVLVSGAAFFFFSFGTRPFAAKGFDAGYRRMAGKRGLQNLKKKL